MGKRKHSGSDEEDTETGSPRQSAPRNRNLEDMLNGDIPELESNQAQIRFRYKKASMKYFGNMDRGTFGISIVVPAVQQAAMILEHTKDILPGFVVGMLEALQKQMPRDKRIAAWLKEYKRMEAAMKSRGASQRAGKGKKLSEGAQRSSKRQKRANRQDDDGDAESEEIEGACSEEGELGPEADPLEGLQQSDMEEEEEEEVAGIGGYAAVEEVTLSILFTLTEDDFQTMSLKHVYESVAAQLDCDYKLIRDHVLHVTDQYLKLISDIREGDAEVEAAVHHGEVEENLGLEEQDAGGSGGEGADGGAAVGGDAASADEEVTNLGAQQQDAAGRHRPDAGAVAATAGAAVAAVQAAAAATMGQQEQQPAADPGETFQRPRRAAAARVAAAVFAVQDGDAGSGHKRSGNRNKSSTLPEGYAEAGLASREKRVWDAKLDKDRAAIVRGWTEEASKENAPVAELVSAANFAVALAGDSSTKQFKQQATMLKNYMQNCAKFSTHFPAGPQPAEQL